MITTVLAEVDERGSLYACGSVNFAILAIFVGLLVANVAVGIWAFSRGTDPSRKGGLGYLAVLFIFFIVSTVVGWGWAAYLAEGSCS